MTKALLGKLNSASTGTYWDCQVYRSDMTSKKKKKKNKKKKTKKKKQNKKTLRHFWSI